MKKCPACEKTYEDSMRFCQVDGTELVDDAPALDPYATMVGQKLDFIPEADKPAEQGIHATTGSVPIAEPDEVLEMPGADPLKTMYVSEAELKEVFDAERKDDVSPPPSPFSLDQPTPQSPYEEAETVVGQRANSPFQPPEPAPVASWQSKQAASNVPFQPNMSGADTQSKGLAIGSLVCGILSSTVCCSMGLFVGPVAMVLGFVAKKKADENPAEFGGRGLALGGIITGAIGLLLGIIIIILQLVSGVLSGLMNAGSNL